MFSIAFGQRVTVDSVKIRVDVNLFWKDLVEELSFLMKKLISS